MSLRTVMEADASIFFDTDECAVEAEYNGTAIDVVIEYGSDKTGGNTFQSGGQTARAMCWVQAADVEAPQPMDEIVVDEVVWQVARILENDGGIYCLELIGKETVWG